MIRAALAGPAADEPGYPTTHGTPALRDAVAGALLRRFGVTVEPTAILPTIGSKELVAWLPTLLGLGPDDIVVIPEVAYPTYEVGARLAGAAFVRSDATTALGPARPGLVWINSPSNPTGRVLPPAHLRKVVEWARARGTIVASDECYLSLGGRNGPRTRSCTRTSAAARTTGCSRCTRCPSPRTSRATGRGSSRVTPRWWPRCWRSASTRA